MIGYVTLGTNDFDRAAQFYDRLLESIGGKRLMNLESFILWGRSFSESCLAIAKPFDGNPATVGNGVGVAVGGNGVAVAVGVAVGIGVGGGWSNASLVTQTGSALSAPALFPSVP